MVAAGAGRPVVETIVARGRIHAHRETGRVWRKDNEAAGAGAASGAGEKWILERLVCGFPADGRFEEHEGFAGRHGKSVRDVDRSGVGEF